MAKKETKKNELKQDTTQQEKMKALEATLSSIEKEFGKGTVMKLGEKTAMQVDVVPTGCLDLDIALGVGGIGGEGECHQQDDSLDCFHIE